jgi:hypothetical protein
MSLEYSVGVEIHLVDHVTAAMNTVNRAIMQAGQHTAALHKQMAEMHATMMKIQAVGQIGGMMFHAGASGLEAMVSHAKAYNFELNKMAVQGQSIAQIHANTRAAIDNSHKDKTTNYTENLRIIGDANAVLGDAAHARELLPHITNAMKIMRASGNEKTAHRADDMTQDAIRALELSGDVGPTRSIKYQAEHLDMIRRGMTAMNGTIGAADYHMFNKNAGTARLQYNDDFKYKVAPYFMQELNQRTGTVFGAMNQSLVQGTITLEAAKRMQKAGLITSHEHLTKDNFKGIAGNSVLGREEFKHNPFEALTKKWIPEIERRNPQIAAMKDENEKNKAIADIINQLKLNKNTTSALSLMAVQQANVHKEGRKFDSIPKEVAAAQIADRNPVNVQKRMSTAYDNVMTHLGNAAMPLALKGMEMLASAMESISSYLDKNPMAPKLAVAVTAATTFVGGIMSLGAALASPVLLLRMAGVSARFGVIGVAIGGAIAAVAGMITAIQNWDKIMAWAKAQARAHMDAIKFALAVGIDVTNKATTAFNQLNVALANILHTIGAAIGNLGKMMGGQNLFSSMGKALNDFGTAQWQKDYVASIRGQNSAAFNALNNFAGVKASPVDASATAMASPLKWIKSGGSQNHSSSFVNHGPMTFNIHQQPGENSKDLTDRLGSDFLRQIQGAMTGASLGGGHLESAFHQGASIG